jgi:prevent-host-death family protein
MTKHFNVGEAKAQLSKLIDAAVRGEDVVIDHAGKPRVRLVPVEDVAIEELARIRAKREAFIGSWKGAFEGYDTSVEGLKAERQYSPWRRAAFGMDDPD